MLEEGVSLARAGRWARVETLSARMHTVVASLAEASRDGSLVTGAQRSRLGRLHNQLIVALQAERRNAQDQLRQLRGVKRAVGAYSGQVRK